MTEKNAKAKLLANDYTTHPLIDGMRRVSSINPYFELPIRDPQQDGWISGEDLFLGNDQRLRHLVRTYGQAFWAATSAHVAGSAFIIAYLTSLVWPVASMLAERGLLLRAAKTPWSGVHHLVRSASRFVPRNCS